MMAAAAPVTPRKPKARARTVLVQGVRFTSRDGHYFSECGRWAIFHMMEGTTYACWELHAIDKDEMCIDYLDGDPALGGIVFHGQRGWFKLETE